MLKFPSESFFKAYIEFEEYLCLRCKVRHYPGGFKRNLPKTVFAKPYCLRGNPSRSKYSPILIRYILDTDPSAHS